MIIRANGRRLVLSNSPLSLILTGFVMLVSSTAEAESGIGAPALMTDKHYAEIWEQQFLLDAGLVTSNFIIVNIPFSRHHGLAVATIWTNEGERVIIKNGRKRKHWSYHEDDRRLTIVHHSLGGADDGFQMRFDNRAAKLDVDFGAGRAGIVITRPDNDLNLPAITQYAVTAPSRARWKPGENSDLPDASADAPWRDLGTGWGYGLHVVQQTPMAKTLDRWRRFTALDADGPYAPVFHQLVTQDGRSHTVLALVSEAGDIVRFEESRLMVADDAQTWSIDAANGSATVDAAITIERAIATSSVRDLLKRIEVSIVGGFADTRRSSSAAIYDIVIDEGGQQLRLTGTAPVEEIVIGR